MKTSDSVLETSDSDSDSFHTLMSVGRKQLLSM